MYFHERRSKSAMVATPRVTHPKPARNPAAAPHSGVVFASATNAARFADLSNAKTNVRPKIFGRLPRLRSSWVKLLVDIHARPKRAGEYQRPPIANVETAAARTASQFRCGIESSS